jgi:dGTPase
MDWNTCYSDQTIGRKRSTIGPRSHYQIDFDRLIFSSAFRRLQSKTQVFPLPGTSFVHNRLTHSLEVASVGRSLGALIGHHISHKFLDQRDTKSKSFYENELSNVISAACLAHDVGNPAFGHSGEEAISHFFTENEDAVIDGRILRSFYSDTEWNDLIHFEGNANALRLLTQDYPGKGKGGLGLTISTLAAILKYPCESSARNKNFKHRKKYGFFASEKDIFLQIVETLHMIEEDNADYTIFKRHPFVYLVEAADDICYNIIDMEDAHRLGILTRDTVAEAYMSVISDINSELDNMHQIKEKYIRLTDDNAAISYLRSKCINTLVDACAEVFIHHADEILAGNYNNTLMGEVEDRAPQLKEIESLSIEKIYNHKSVVEIEIAGFNVMSELLRLFIPAVLSTANSGNYRAARRLIPAQYNADDKNLSPYLRTMLVLDHVSSMTDDYATEMYRKIKGIEISRHS